MKIWFIEMYKVVPRSKKRGISKDNKCEWKSGLFLLKWRNKSIKLRISLIYSRKTCYKHPNRKIIRVKTKTNTRVTPASDLYLADHVTRNGTIVEIQDGAELGWIQVIMIYLS
jgi:hypothetical protein